MKLNVAWNKYWPQFLAATPALFTVLSFSTHLGWTSPALQQYLIGQNTSLILTNEQGSWFVSIISIGSLVGLLGTVVLSNLCGRKLTIVFVTIPLLLGWLIIIFATKVWMLYVARFMAGIGMGMSATMVPVYTGEIATDDLRGALSSMFQIMLAFGPILEYAIVPVSTVRISSAMSASIPIFILIIIYWCMPESPYYLLIKKRESEALDILKKLRRTDDVEEEFKKMQKTVIYQTEHKGTFKELLIRKNNRNGLIIMFGIYTIQAFCGTVVILFYAHVIFSKVDHEIVTVSPNILALVMIIIPWISSCISSGLVDYFGKKPLLILSTFSCFVTMSGVGIYFNFFQNSKTHWVHWLPVVSLISFKFVHGLGIAGIPFIQLSEMFSANIKVYAVCTCKCYLFILHFIANKLFQIISDSLGFYVPFYIFAGFSLLGVFFTIFFVPETRGKSLHEIQLILGATYNTDEEKKEGLTMKSLK